jgi:putative membrane protein
MSRALAAPGHYDPSVPFWAAWPSEPVLLLAVAFGAALYAIGWFNLRERAGKPVYPAWRAWCFAAGMAALGTALLSPVAVYAEQLFFMHMIQHLLLLLIAPPLLWLGKPLVPVISGLPARVRLPVARRIGPGSVWARVGHVLTMPGVAVALYVGSVAIWHIPQFYDAAQGRTLTHDIEHLAFFVPALLYWWPIVHPSGGRRRLSVGRAIPYLLPPFLEGIIIGAMISFADRPLYETYREMEPTWGFSTVGDQQLGGLIMWVPGGMLFLIPLIGLLVTLLRQEERQVDQRPTRTAA